MGASGYYIASALFMIAASSFAGHGQAARNEYASIVPMIGGLLSAALSIVMFIVGVVAASRKKDAH